LRMKRDRLTKITDNRVIKGMAHSVITPKRHGEQMHYEGILV